jgi:hypothetical protein
MHLAWFRPWFHLVPPGAETSQIPPTHRIWLGSGLGSAWFHPSRRGSHSKCATENDRVPVLAPRGSTWLVTDRRPPPPTPGLVLALAPLGPTMRGEAHIPSPGREHERRSPRSRETCSTVQQSWRPVHWFALACSFARRMPCTPQASEGSHTHCGRLRKIWSSAEMDVWITAQH